VLIVMSMSAVRGYYQTGSPFDVGWMLPFFFAAWAAATAPASPPEPATPLRWGAEESSHVVILIALLFVPIIGYGSIAVMPLGARLDRLRELATAFTLVSGIAVVMLRLRVERRMSAMANERVRLLATACEQAGELIIIVRDRHIEYANDAFCRAVGYSREELEHVEPFELVADVSRSDLPQLRERIRNREVVRAETIMSRRDGTTFPASWVAAPIVDSAGRVSHIISVVRDLTGDVRLRAQLVRSERLSAIGEFVAGVAHEINNPLQSVIGSLELVLHEHRPDPALRADLQRATAEAGRAGRIVRNLLTFVRQSPTERVLIDLNETVKATMAVRAYELEVAGVKVVEEYAPGLPLVLASRDEIQQVLVNLIVNAQEAMSGVAATPVLTVRTHLVGTDAAVDVCDTGAGVPETIAGRIFEPFFTTRASETSIGLGLSMSLGIAQSHRGDLELVPRPTGTCFRLTLPGAGFPGPTVGSAVA
jgi:PAS domain S-box-containing protein